MADIPPLSESLADRLDRHLSKTPTIAKMAYIAAGAQIIGDVTIGDAASIWPGAILRGDINSIHIGPGSNVQDGTVVHLADDYGVRVGSDVTIGHACVIHACTIEDRCLIGMHSTILDGAVIGENAVIGAHSLVTKGTQIPPRSLAMGVPAKVIRPLTDAEAQDAATLAIKYKQVALAHRDRDEQHL